MTSFTPGPLTAHKECVFFANNAGGFSLSDCPAPEANAHRIARCWNSHAELLEALQNLLILYQGKKQGVLGESLNTVKKARAAIAKATS